MSKIIKGKIISLKMNKTATVAVETTKIHPVYKKILNLTKKFKAHYEGNDLHLNDKVTIKEVKPISKTKNWIVINKQ